MNVVQPQLRRYFRRLLAIQVFLVAVAALIVHFRYGNAESGALAYGGAIAVTGTLILIWYGRRSEGAGSSLARNASVVYGSAIVRFVSTVALFAAGFAFLKLEPLPLFIGFILGLLGQLISTAVVPGNMTWRVKR